MKKLFTITLTFFLLFSGCTHTPSASRTIFAMDTVMQLTIYGENAGKSLDAIATAIRNYEQVFSPTIVDSEVQTINRNGGSSMLSSDMKRVLTNAEAFAKETGGAFDPMLAPLVDLWGNGHVPEQAKINDARAHSGYKNMKLSQNSCTLRPNTGLNLGGIAKGAVSDDVLPILKEYGITSAILSLGGNIVAHGSRPDKSPWVVGVRDPDGEATDTLGVLKVHDKFVISSGDYERFFIENGKRYHHIINPKTGYPADNDLRSVVIVCENGAMADAYSTALFVMGSEAALNFWRKHTNFEALLVLRNHRIIITQGLKNSFTLSDGRYTYEVENR